ncbi:hypothetical protein [Kitasatospora sp. A2-31]|uniref:hypothetical protein n=1 Tax=Kitasatospora sp. A2-31 TaxID=2916414 RepID=UPI001EE7FC6D|nr:hypothetical protein [Kitasatospora sp. A2-31]MCG6493420.1 hypothetical protein [Kitasatospora sp. A2-31]
MTTIPPPPTYRPAVGPPPATINPPLDIEPVEDNEPETEQDDDRAALLAFADRLGALIAETPEERRERQHAEREAQFEAAGETPDQRKARHKAEAREAKRKEARARQKATAGPSGRTRRFRRWCILTAISASAGYALSLPQALAAGGTGVALLASGAGWALDLRLRGWGRIRISEIRHPLGIAVLVVCRIPVASGLVAALSILPTT